MLNFEILMVFDAMKVSKLHIWQFYFNETISGNVPGRISVRKTI